jgi:hypothetical protein
LQGDKLRDVGPASLDAFLRDLRNYPRTALSA